jgi:nickel transport protein
MNGPLADFRTIVILVLRQCATMNLSHVRLRAALWLLPGVLAAHDLETSISLAAPAVIVRASYGGSDPAPFAKVQVFAPAAPAHEFQTGMTDRRGYFSFVPEGGGNWRVVVDDEEGHRREVNVAVPEPFASDTQAPQAGASRLERALLGLALIFGVTGFLYGFKARRHSG